MAYLQGTGAEGDYIANRFDVQWKAKRGYTDTEMDQHVAWPNVAFEPPDHAPWVRITVRQSGADQASIGDNPLHRHDGMVVIEVFVPRGTGEDTLDTYCDDAADIFRDHTGQQGLRFRSPYAVPVGNVEGGWYKKDVLIPFTRDTVFTG